MCNYNIIKLSDAWFQYVKVLITPAQKDNDSQTTKFISFKKHCREYLWTGLYYHKNSHLTWRLQTLKSTALNTLPRIVTRKCEKSFLNITSNLGVNNSFSECIKVYEWHQLTNTMCFVWVNKQASFGSVEIKVVAIPHIAWVGISLFISKYYN